MTISNSLKSNLSKLARKTSSSEFFSPNVYDSFSNKKSTDTEQILSHFFDKIMFDNSQKERFKKKEVLTNPSVLGRGNAKLLRATELHLEKYS